MTAFSDRQRRVHRRIAGIDVALERRANQTLRRIVKMKTAAQAKAEVARMMTALADIAEPQMVALARWSWDETVRALARSVPLNWWRRLTEETEAEQIAFETFEPPSEALLRTIVFSQTVAPDGIGWKRRTVLARRAFTDKAIQDAIVRAYAEGLLPREIERRVRPLVHGASYKVRRVVRTESARIANAMQEIAFEQASDFIRGFELNETLDAVTRDSHRERHGRRFNKGQFRPALPDAPNCRGWYEPILVDDPPDEPRARRPRLPEAA